MEEYEISKSDSIFSDYFLHLFLNNTDINVKRADKNFIHVSIFFSTMITKTLEEKVAYTWLALMSDVGGAFGLVLGSTFLTVFEFLDFIVFTITDFMAQSNKKK